MRQIAVEYRVLANTCEAYVLSWLLIIMYSTDDWCGRTLRAGRVLPVLAKRPISQVSILRRRPSGRVQHAAVRAQGVQGHRRTGQYASPTYFIVSFSLKHVSIESSVTQPVTASRRRHYCRPPFSLSL